jgi:hypothetical protein
MSITATCRLEWHYQLSKKIMGFSLIFWRIVFEAANLVMTDRLFLRTAGYLRFGKNWHHIIFLQIVLDGGSQFGGDGQTIFTDRWLSEICRELALHNFWAECFGGSRLGDDGQIVMTFRRLSQIWRELALHYFPVDCFGGIRFGVDGQTIFTDSRLSEIRRELAPHYFLADYFGLIFFIIIIKINMESEYNSNLQIGMV